MLTLVSWLLLRDSRCVSLLWFQRVGATLVKVSWFQMTKQLQLVLAKREISWPVVKAEVELETGAQISGMSVSPSHSTPRPCPSLSSSSLIPDSFVYSATLSGCFSPET